jgi:hypothetical protein
MLATSSLNPYEPSRVLSPRQVDASVRESFLVPYRLDLLTLITIAASAIHSLTVWWFLSNGSGRILDPDLARLASHSLLWVPIYHLTGPALLAVMPRTCRESFASLFLAIGIVFSINNACGALWGRFVVMENVNLPTAVGICVASALVVFAILTISRQHRIRTLLHGMTWLCVICLLKSVFYAISLLV